MPRGAWSRRPSKCTGISGLAAHQLQRPCALAGREADRSEPPIDSDGRSTDGAGSSGHTDMKPHQSSLWPLRPLRPCGFSPLLSAQRPNKALHPTAHPASRCSAGCPAGDGQDAGQKGERQRQREGDGFTGRRGGGEARDGIRGSIQLARGWRPRVASMRGCGHSRRRGLAECALPHVPHLPASHGR